MTVISWKARHPDRAAQAAQRQTAVLAQKFVGGRAAKEALMVHAREIAAGGGCAGWLQVLEAMARAGHDAPQLRIWATTKDKSEIDRLCARARGAKSWLGSSRFKPRKT
jgi:hypothetical protein